MNARGVFGEDAIDACIDRILLGPNYGFTGDTLRSATFTTRYKACREVVCYLLEENAECKELIMNHEGTIHRLLSNNEKLLRIK